MTLVKSCGLVKMRPSLDTVTRDLGHDAQHCPEFAPHVERFFELLREGKTWPPKEWDEETDTIAYGRQLVNLTREQTREVYYRLRERHTFRPSVAEVRAVVDELLAQADPTRKLTDAEVKMPPVHSAPRALPSAANGPHREMARREHARRRASLGHTPERKAENQAPASAPASLVGLLVTVLMKGRAGRESRGIVFAENDDQVRVKFGDFDFQWVDKSLVRVEAAR